MRDAVKCASETIRICIARHPENPFYIAASRQVQAIEDRLANGAPPDRAFYDSLTRGAGLMCARELEASDAEFCEAVYAMLEEIRLRAL